jgi:hypothetical protein
LTSIVPARLSRPFVNVTSISQPGIKINPGNVTFNAADIEDESEQVPLK